MNEEVLDLLQDLERECPIFQLEGSQVEVFSEPAEFYAFLIDGCKRAERRVVLASLYLGNGQLSQCLVEAVQQALETSPGLEVRVLLDCQRGSRGDNAKSPSSRRMLAPLLEKFQERCQVSLYHTPTLRGFLRWLLPDRWNEVIGLQHMKVYIFDDDLVISGANLNDDYFCERQDRYVVFRKAAALAQFYTELVAAVSRFSFQLAPDGKLQLDPSCTEHPYLGNKQKYLTLVREELNQLFTRWRDKTTTPSPPGLEDSTSKSARSLRLRGSVEAGGDASKDALSPAADQPVSEAVERPVSKAAGVMDTWVCPTVNLAPAGVHLDERVSQRLLESRSLRGACHLATGYFNLTDDNMAALISNARRPASVLCAHPTANGFLKARDISRFIPAAYSHLLFRFWRALGLESPISVLEYQRPGWTFHSKGLWCHASGEETPSATVVGSSNFGYRSSARDLESQVVIATQNPALRAALAEERRKLYSYSSPVDGSTFARPDRVVPFWVRFVSRFIRHFF